MEMPNTYTYINIGMLTCLPDHEYIIEYSSDTSTLNYRAPWGTKLYEFL